MFVGLDHRHDFSARAALAEARDKSFGLLAVIDGLEHSCNDCYLSSHTEEIGHEFAGNQPIQSRLDAHHRGALAHGSVGRDTDNPRPLPLSRIDQWSHSLGIARRHDDAAKFGCKQLFEGGLFAASQFGHRHRHEVDAAAGVAIALVANSVPELVVEVSDLLGDADADANMSAGREGAGRGVWFVTDLASDLENAL